MNVDNEQQPDLDSNSCDENSDGEVGGDDVGDEDGDVDMSVDDEQSSDEGGRDDDEKDESSSDESEESNDWFIKNLKCWCGRTADTACDDCEPAANHGLCFNHATADCPRYARFLRALTRNRRQIRGTRCRVKNKRRN